MSDLQIQAFFFLLLLLQNHLGNSMQIDRRTILAGSAIFGLSACMRAMPAKQTAVELPNAAMAALEAKAGGRLGALILDTASGKMTGHRQDELFGMCSTFKLALAATVLQAGQRGTADPEKMLSFTKADIVANSPAATANLDKGGMTLLAMAEAVQKTSDNTAANLLIREFGGPEAITRIFRSWGDETTRLDRYEPEMNNVPPGEVRDTTTPRAFAQMMARLLTDDAILDAPHRQTLIQWMIDTKTGTKRIRAGLPLSWRAGDKTGTGWGSTYNNKTNDVALFWPPSRSPVIVTAYYEADGKYDDIRDADQAVLAEVGRIAAAQAVEWHGELD